MMKEKKNPPIFFSGMQILSIKTAAAATASNANNGKSERERVGYCILDLLLLSNTQQPM